MATGEPFSSFTLQPGCQNAQAQQQPPHFETVIHYCMKTAFLFLLLTIGLAGYDGGKMGRPGVVDHCIVAPSDHIPRIQEAQATLYHALLEVIQEELSSGTIPGSHDHLKDQHLQTGVVQ